MLPHNSKAPFAFYTVPTLSEEEKRPPDFIVEGMIPCGLSFLSGAPKTRKSFMALQLAAAVARGAPFLGHQTIKCDVAYLDLEGSKSRISSRSANMSVSVPENVLITNQTAHKLATGLVDDLRSLHQAQPSIRLIIIDTYSRARGNVKSGSANAYDADVSLLEPLQRLATDEKIAVLCVHHDRKGAAFVSDTFERLSGTMGISGSADCVMALIQSGKRFDGHATLEYTPRDARGGEISLFFADRMGEWQTVAAPVSGICNNSVCQWIVRNKPERGKEGVFFSYEDVHTNALRFFSDSPGDKVRSLIAPHLTELFETYKIGVQLGVQSHGKRGIRIINLS